VRFGEEIAGLRELGMTGRGMYAEIGTYIENTVNHELSGNVIDLCPVGALTAKPSRFLARAWEVRQTESVAPHDAVGSNVFIHTLRDKLVRVVPRANEAINEVWISDRDRFSYQGVMHADRIAAPMVKKNGEWVVTDWPTAIDTALDGIKSVVEGQGADALGAWVSPQATLEEMYLLQGIVRHLGSHNIDHRTFQVDFRGQGHEAAKPLLGVAIEEIEQQNCIFLVGSNIRKEQPIIAHRIRKASLAGAVVHELNPRDFDLRLDSINGIYANPSAMVSELASVAAAAGASRPSVNDLIRAATPEERQQTIADSLKNAERGLIVLGQLAVQHPDYSILNELAGAIGESLNVVCSVLPAAGNTVGAWQAGVVPHRLAGGSAVDKPGKNISDMQTEPVSALILHNIEPEQDCADPVAALKAANAADFCVVLSPYVGEHTKDYANVILPIVPYSETDGTFINMEGLAQTFSAAVKNYAESAPAWKVYRVMGEQLGIEGYQFELAGEVTAEALHLGQDNSAARPMDTGLNPHLDTKALLRAGEVSIYATDSLVRRAKALQDTVDGQNRRLVVMNSKTAEKAGVANATQVLVTQDGQVVDMPLCIDDGMADDSIWLPLIPELGGLNAEVQIKAVW
jgi:NADH-quinone oxidoreductase subunit G